MLSITRGRAMLFLVAEIQWKKCHLLVWIVKVNIVEMMKWKARVQRRYSKVAGYILT